MSAVAGVERLGNLEALILLSMQFFQEQKRSHLQEHGWNSGERQDDMAKPWAKTRDHIDHLVVIADGLAEIVKLIGKGLEPTTVL